MNAIENLHNRTSMPAATLTTPAPSGDHLETILRAAVSAPDHKTLKPWRFILIEGEALDQLGEIYAAAARQRNPDITAEDVARQRSKPSRSPLLIVVVAKISSDAVPVIEQLLSAGCAAQHMQLAAQALGYGSVWVTGENAYDSNVKSALGLDEQDQIVGFLHMGTPTIARPNAQRPDPYEFVTYWQRPTY